MQYSVVACRQSGSESGRVFQAIGGSIDLLLFRVFVGLFSGPYRSPLPICPFHQSFPFVLPPVTLVPSRWEDGPGA